MAKRRVMALSYAFADAFFLPPENATMTATPPFDRSAAVGFSHNPPDRLSDKRDDAHFIDDRMAAPSTRFFVLAGDTPVLNRNRSEISPLFARDEAWALGQPEETVFLGVEEGGVALFGIRIGKAHGVALAGREDVELIDLRSLALRGLLPPPVLGELGGAKALLDWHSRHRFCANCGKPSHPAAAGWRRECPACETQHFPRVDPVVIMLAIDSERCLLGRQARFSPGVYSALAGFLEPGETIEDAVRREVREETAVTCSRIAYFASQPWPFPSSLMIGCFARAETTQIQLDANELEDARWFRRDELDAMFSGTHPAGLLAPAPFAIAHHLLKAFGESGAGVLD
jgi:NAD+ diphosphatase